MGPLQILRAYRPFLQTFGILSWSKQEEKKPRSQNFNPGPVWIKSLGQIELRPGALPGFKWWRAAANSLREKSQEKVTASGTVALQRLDNFCIANREISGFAPSYFPFFTS